MPIRFACPACRQPLEVEDAWGGDSVACPYCKRVITAPQSSTWPAQQVLQASPAASSPPQPSQAGPHLGPGPAFGSQPPPPPLGYHGYSGVAAPSPKAVRGLTFALVGLALVAFAWLGWFAVSATDASRRMSSPNPAPQEIEAIQKEMMEDFASGKLRPPRVTQVSAVLGSLCGLAGAALGIGAILAGEPRRGMAITSCVLGITFCLCPTPFFMILLMHGT